MGYEQNDNNERKQESVYSKRIKAGKRRTYFFDVRETRTSDFYLTITESRKRFDSDGYDRHKIFIYKEDFNKFYKGLGETIDYIKTDLMPDFDFDAFNHDTPYEPNDNGQQAIVADAQTTVAIQPNDIAEPDEKKIETEKMKENVAPTSTSASDESSTNNLHTEEVDKW